MSSLLRKIFGAGNSVVRPDDRKALTLDAEMNITVVGYSAEEFSALLAVYREHMTLSFDTLQRAQQQADAVRYQPDGA